MLQYPATKPAISNVTFALFLRRSSAEGSLLQRLKASPMAPSTPHGGAWNEAAGRFATKLSLSLHRYGILGGMEIYVCSVLHTSVLIVGHQAGLRKRSFKLANASPIAGTKEEPRTPGESAGAGVLLRYLGARAA